MSIVMFSCVTCHYTGDASEITKHLSSTRHKSAESGDEVIACEECEDSNIHQLQILRFGLSEMSLLCNQCAAKEDSPSALYTLSNGSFFQKLGQYYKLVDMECQYCGSVSHLFVANPQGKPQMIVCRNCLPKATEENQRISFVSERDDHFLTELLGIKEHVAPGGKRRSRKVGRKGGRNDKKSRPKVVLPEAEERRAHYQNKIATAKAIKSGATMRAVGSNELSAPGSGASSRIPSRTSTPQPNKGKGKGNDKRNDKRNDKSGAKPGVKNGTKNEVKNGAKNEAKPGAKDGAKSGPKTGPISGPKSGPKSGSNSVFKSGSKPHNHDSLGKDRNNDKTPAGNSNNGSGTSNKKGLKPLSGPIAHNKNNGLSSQSRNEAKPSKGNVSSNKRNSKKPEDNKKDARNPGKENSNPKTESTVLKQAPEVKEIPLELPPGIAKYNPSPEPPLTYPSMDEYFREISYLLFMEEKLSMGASNMSYLEPQDMFLEWYQEQNKKHKQFKVTIPLTDHILDKFLSKKMQQLKKTPFGLNLAIILMLGDDIAWYAQVMTSDSVKAKKGGRNGPMVLEMVAELYSWNNMPLPLSVNVKHLRILPVSVPVSRVFLAMSRIDNPKFIKMLLGNEPIKQIVFKNFLTFKNRVNESQKVAVQSVLNNAITVLQGPPGTGKTSTIHEIILQLLELKTFPILVVAASNIAIDNIAEKLIKTHGREILRIVSNEKEKEYSRDHPLASICLHHKVYDALPQQMKQTVDDLRRPFSNVSQNLYKKLLTQQIKLSDMFTAQAKVIFTTTVVAGGNQLKLVKKLPVVIMDEATQSSEPTTLIPLSMPGVDKFVFVGDQRQLSSFSMVPNLSLSLFERVLLNNSYRNPHMLDTQYRMHPAISEFPRVKFYDELLKDGITADDRAMDNIPENPVYFWDTKGKAREDRVRYGFREDRGYTYSNLNEIEYVTKVLMKLIYDKQVSKSDIGVITPYRGQRDLISNQLVKNDLINPEKEEVQVEVDRDDIYNESKPVTVHLVSGIMIASIDAFQGREKNFLVMSCVRSNEERKIGFLNDKRRLNVALTRAKYGLILIGDVSCLKGDELWREYLEFLEKKGSVFSSDEFLY